MELSMKYPTRIIIPEYVQDFRCIGGACEESCCIGWDIDIDKKSFKKYRKSSDQELKKLFSDFLYRNRISRSKETDYGKIAIRANRWCPFLNDDKLCKIHKKTGEAALSNVCHTYPRNFNITDGVWELSLYLSCPEAVRQLLSQKEPIVFLEMDFNNERFIISSEINTGDRIWRKSPVSRLPELRTQSIAILQDRSHSISNRLIKLGFEMAEVSGKEETTERPSAFSRDHLELLVYAIESLGMMGEEESPLFAEYTAKALDTFSGSSLTEIRKVNETVLEPFMDSNSHLFEHYLVNTVFQENFPFTFNDEAFDGYVMLVLRYALVLFYLAAIAVCQESLSFENVVSMVQIHSKVINHHKSFGYNILQEIKRKGYDNMSFLPGIIF